MLYLNIKENEKYANLRIFFVFTQYKMMNVYVFMIVAVVIFMLIFPLFLQMRFYVNVFYNIATISLSLFGIFTLTSFQLELQKGALNFLSPKKSNKEKLVKIVDVKYMFSYLFFKQIFIRLKINEISLFFAIGKNNDAFLPSMVSGGFLCFVHSLLAIMQTKKGNFKVNVGTIVDCNKDILKFSGYFGIRISLFNIFLSLIFAIYSKLKTRSKDESK